MSRKKPISVSAEFSGKQSTELEPLQSLLRIEERVKELLGPCGLISYSPRASSWSDLNIEGVKDPESLKAGIASIIECEGNGIFNSELDLDGNAYGITACFKPAAAKHNEQFSYRASAASETAGTPDMPDDLTM